MILLKLSYLPQVSKEEQVEHRSLFPIRTQKNGVPSLLVNTPGIEGDRYK